MFLVTVNALHSFADEAEAVGFAEASDTLLASDSGSAAITVKEASTQRILAHRVKPASQTGFTVGLQEAETIAAGVIASFNKLIPDITVEFSPTVVVTDNSWSVAYSSMVTQLRSEVSPEILPEAIVAFQTAVQEALTKVALRGISLKP